GSRCHRRRTRASPASTDRRCRGGPARAGAVRTPLRAPRAPRASSRVRTCSRSLRTPRPPNPAARHRRRSPHRRRTHPANPRSESPRRRLPPPWPFALLLVLDAFLGGLALLLLFALVRLAFLRGVFERLQRPVVELLRLFGVLSRDLIGLLLVDEGQVDPHRAFGRGRCD